MFSKTVAKDDNRNLSMWTAVIHTLIPFERSPGQRNILSFVPRKTLFFPRHDGKTITPDTYLPTITEELKKLDHLTAIDECYLDRAKDSLKEVKALTEYQDQKAARLLTIVAFLTAAAGALFSKLLDVYPLYQVLPGSVAKGAFLAFVYALFGLFLILVACGALVTFHAIQTRFVWPEEKPHEANYDRANSFLFFQSILRTAPAGWAVSFVERTSAIGCPDRLSLLYYKNYIAETYLIAAKLGDKLRYLQPGQQLLQYAIRALLIWLLLVFIVALWMPRAPITKPQESTVAPICYRCLGA
jgi:hypothetical protein